MIPLSRKVKVDPAFQAVVRDMFGQVLLCKDKDVATKVGGYWNGCGPDVGVGARVVKAGRQPNARNSQALSARQSVPWYRAALPRRRRCK